MSGSITPGTIKENNRQLIYRYLYQHPGSSQQDVAYHLHFSRPTVADKISALESSGLIRKDGIIPSDSAGRKAAAYSINPLCRIAIGVELTDRDINMVAVDLYGRKASEQTIPAAFSPEDMYFRTVGKALNNFIAGISVPEESILGIGFAMQALVSPDGQTITYGEIQHSTGLSIGQIAQYLSYPCRFIHDAAAAAAAELWISPELMDAVYLSLSYHFSSAVIAGRKVAAGKHGHTGTLEHIQIVPNGRQCYCGLRGCAETVCSMDALLQPGENLEEFFHSLRNESEDHASRQENDRAQTAQQKNDRDQTAQCTNHRVQTAQQQNHCGHAARWQRYLSYLARVISSAHLFCDLDYVLGGPLAKYLTESDIQYLYDTIQQQTPFHEEQDFLHISRMPDNSIAIGAALPYIEDFLQNIPE